VVLVGSPPTHPIESEKESQNADATHGPRGAQRQAAPRRDRPPYGTPIFLGFVCELAAEAEGYRKGRDELMKE
jgi:hypothetical protein